MVNLFWWWPDARALGGDKYLYDQLGWALARDGFNFQSFVDLPVQDLGTTFYIGIIYTFFGHNPAAVAIINTLIVSLTGLQIYRLAYRYVSVQNARRATILWILLPASLLLSSFPSKEILVSFLGIFITNQIILILAQINKSKSVSVWPQIILVIFSVAIFLSIRAMMVIPLMVIIVMQCWFQMRGFRNILYSFLMLLVIVVFSGGLIRFRSTILERQTLVTPLPLATAFIDRLGFTYNSVESSLTLRTYWNNEWGKAYWIPLRIPLTLYTPFPPIYFSNIIDIGGSLNVWLLILITPGIIGAFRSKRANVRKQISVLAPVWLPIVGLGTALSAGLPFMQWRYAVMAFPYMIILATIGFEHKRYTKLLYIYMVLFFAFASIIYLLIKQY